MAPTFSKWHVVAWDGKLVVRTTMAAMADNISERRWCASMREEASSFYIPPPLRVEAIGREKGGQAGWGQGDGDTTTCAMLAM
jgi:hypothetical protein